MAATRAANSRSSMLHDCRDLRADAVHLICDQAGAEVEQRLDLRGIDRCPHSGAQVAGVAIVLLERRAASEIDLERVLVPVRREAEHLVEATPAQDSRRLLARLAADVHRPQPEVLRPERVRVHRRQEAGEIRHAGTLASPVRPCRGSVDAAEPAVLSSPHAAISAARPSGTRRTSSDRPVHRAPEHRAGKPAGRLHAGNDRASLVFRDRRSCHPGRARYRCPRHCTGGDHLSRRSLWLDADLAVAQEARQPRGLCGAAARKRDTGPAT